MYLGIDVGGTKTLLAILNDEGVIIERIKFPTSHNYGEFLNDVAHNVANLSTNDYKAAGVGVPGRFNKRRDQVVAFGNLPWQNVSIPRDIKRILRKPSVFENDAKLGALSEAMLLKNKYNRVLYVTIGTGIGTGFVVDQHIEKELRYSEAGKMPMEHNGKVQAWEDFASGRAIVQRFGKRASEITEYSVWEIISRDIAIGLADLVTELMPDIIIMGGGVDKYFDRFKDQLNKDLKSYETPLISMPPVQQALRPEDAVIYGCYDLAREVFGND